MRRRRWDWVDCVLVGSLLPTLLFTTVAYLSIPIEETHEVGNDAAFDRAVIVVAGLWVLACAGIIFVRRLPDGLKGQWRSERQLWREMREADSRRDGDQL